MTYTELHYPHRGILDPERFARHVQLRCYRPAADMQAFVDCYLWPAGTSRDNQATGPPTSSPGLSHFTNDFRRLLGVSPSQYVKMVLGKQPSDHLPPKSIIVR